MNISHALALINSPLYYYSNNYYGGGGGSSGYGGGSNNYGSHGSGGGGHGGCCKKKDDKLYELLAIGIAIAALVQVGELLFFIQYKVLYTCLLQLPMKNQVVLTIELYF